MKAHVIPLITAAFILSPLAIAQTSTGDGTPPPISGAVLFSQNLKTHDLANLSSVNYRVHSFDSDKLYNLMVLLGGGFEQGTGSTVAGIGGAFQWRFKDTGAGLILGLFDQIDQNRKGNLAVVFGISFGL